MTPEKPKNEVSDSDKKKDDLGDWVGDNLPLNEVKILIRDTADKFKKLGEDIIDDAPAPPDSVEDTVKGMGKKSGLGPGSAIDAARKHQRKIDQAGQ